MPESEPKPKLIEQVAPGAGQGWKAVLRSGKAVVVHEIPVPQAEAAAAAPRLQRLFEHRHPALSPVLGWGTDANGLWVAVEPNEGTPLGTMLTRGPLTPPAAAALGGAVLSGVAALHEAGIAMGGFGATAIRVTSNGEVRLAGHPAAAVRGAPSQSDLRADVRSSGMAVCAAFGVDPAGAPAPANIPPGLVVTMRSMASGAMGPSADRAQGALREMASALLAPDRQMAAQTELATRAGGREVPAVTPFLPEDAAAVPSPQTTPSSGTLPAVSPTPAVAPAAPAPYLAPPRRDETPVRVPVSYDAPDRPLQTYPSLPAVTFPPAAAAPAAAPDAQAPPAVPAAPAAAVPVWSDAVPAVPAPVTPGPGGPPAFTRESTTTNPPPPAAVDQPEPAAPTWQTNPPAPAPSPTPAWQTAAPAPAPAFASAPPAPASSPTAPEVRPATPEAQTWTPVEQPAWKPGEVVPAEPLGSGVPLAEARTPTAPPAATPTPAPVPRAPAAAARKPLVARPKLPGPLMERPPWLVPAAAAAVIVILLGGVGGFMLANRGANPSASVQQTPSAHPTASARATPSTRPSGGPLAVPAYAPASAGTVSKVQICSQSAPCSIPGAAPENATNCDLGGSCRVEVAVYFTAVQKSVPVSYTLKFFDRCSGQTTDLPGTRTTTPATGWIVAIPTDHLAVSLPAGVKSGALVAVAQQPGVAASAPLLLGGTSC
jgi:hypothetical protein